MPKDLRTYPFRGYHKNLTDTPLPTAQQPLLNRKWSFFSLTRGRVNHVGGKVLLNVESPSKRDVA